MFCLRAHQKFLSKMERKLREKSSWNELSKIPLKFTSKFTTHWFFFFFFFLWDMLASFLHFFYDFFWMCSFLLLFIFYFIFLFLVLICLFSHWFWLVFVFRKKFWVNFLCFFYFYWSVHLDTIFLKYNMLLFVLFNRDMMVNLYKLYFQPNKKVFHPLSTFPPSQPNTNEGN